MCAQNTPPKPVPILTHAELEFTLQICFNTRYNCEESRLGVCRRIELFLLLIGQFSSCHARFQLNGQSTCLSPIISITLKAIISLHPPKWRKNFHKTEFWLNEHKNYTPVGKKKKKERKTDRRARYGGTKAQPFKAFKISPNNVQRPGPLPPPPPPELHKKKPSSTFF